MGLRLGDRILVEEKLSVDTELVLSNANPCQICNKFPPVTCILDLIA
jgi:hypothetical protein